MKRSVALDFKRPIRLLNLSAT